MPKNVQQKFIEDMNNWSIFLSCYFEAVNTLQIQKAELFGPGALFVIGSGGELHSSLSREFWSHQ